MRAVIQVAAVVLGGAATVVLLASTGSTAGWVWGLLFGVLYPGIGLLQWSSMRRRGPEFAGYAERLLGMLLGGQIGIIGLAASVESLKSECIEAPAAAIPPTDQRSPG